MGLEYLLVGIALILLVVIYYIYTKDIHTSKQLRRVAMAVETLHKELYLLDKKLSRHIHETPPVDEGVCSDERIHDLEASMKNRMMPLEHSVKDLHHALQQHRDDMEHKIRTLEDTIRQLSLPTSVSGMDDSRIIALYQQGVDIAGISKELRLSKPEVEFVLKLHKIR
ncbi:MAG: hypothetical protein DSZ03_05210 [Sulfurimonas sp.]|nr:MAG: hypothetical protein DSZ03_05210 [Sulfurimonas sp.]